MKLLFFSLQEVERLTIAAPPGAARLLFRFLFRTGSRISEALAMKETDIHDGFVTLKTLKQRRPTTRNIPVSPSFLAELVAWHKAKSRATARLWPCTRQNAQYWLETAREKAGIKGGDRRSFHAFRHGFAKHVLDSGGDLRDLQRYLGHASIMMTSRYLAITKDHMKKLHNIDFEPRQRGIFD